MKKQQPAPVEKKEAPYTQEAVSDEPVISPVSDAQLILADVPEEDLIEMAREDGVITFIESQAAIRDIRFPGHQDYVFSFVQGLYLDRQELRFTRQSETEDVISFVHEDDKQQITKTFKFGNSISDIELEINIRNKSEQAVSASYGLLLGALDLGIGGFDARYQDITIAEAGRMRRFNGKKTETLGDVDFVSVRDRYFCAILDPEAEYQGFVKSVDRKYGFPGIALGKQTIPPNGQIGHFIKIYCGPQDLEALSAIKKQWGDIIYYGFFDPISHILVSVLNFIHGIMHNWGLAIICLSGMIYILLFPLTRKQMRSMKAMQTLQPHMEEIRRTYKDNPQKMNKEIMELYRKHKVNPFSGCLPIFLQMPIFFALYPVLMRSVVLRGAKFLWIKDLSMPDRIAQLPAALPVLGQDLNLLPILMAIGMFFQQKMSMKQTQSSQAAEQQKIMMFIFPIMFGFIFYRMPSGLVLYWFVNSMLMLAFQFNINRTR